jgi:hypothetical protein
MFVAHALVIDWLNDMHRIKIHSKIDPCDHHHRIRNASNTKAKEGIRYLKDVYEDVSDVTH